MKKAVKAKSSTSGSKRSSAAKVVAVGAGIVVVSAATGAGIGVVSAVVLGAALAVMFT